MVAGSVKAAVGDGVLTFLWVFSASSLGIFTSLIAAALGVAAHQWLATFCITTCLVFVYLFIFGIIGDALGGATFNPTATAAFHAVGLGGPHSLYAAALRFPAQAFGAIGGAMAIKELMPEKYKYVLEGVGPSLKVDTHTGAIAEGLLTFVITFLVLFIILRGPKSLILKHWLLSISTVALVVAGTPYTGPSMNPANAFGWAYLKGGHNTWEHFYVYWICPFIGAISAAWIFRFVFPPPPPASGKDKTA